MDDATGVVAELRELERQLAACKSESAANIERRVVLLERGLAAGLSLKAMAEAAGVNRTTYAMALGRARAAS